jgi:hypothetical protein
MILERWKRAGEDLEAKVFLIAQTVRATLDDVDLGLGVQLMSKVPFSKLSDALNLVP